MRRVLALRQFRRLALAYGLNEIATQVASVALVTLVYRRTGSAYGAAAVFLCTMILPAVASPPLVGRIERVAVSVSLPALYGFEVLLFGALAAAAAARLGVFWLLLLALIDGTLALVARSLARVASVAATADQGLLREGNAVNNTIFSVCYMLGPGLGGLLLIAGGTTVALSATAGIFALVSVTLATAPELPQQPVPAPTDGGRTRTALKHVWQNEALRRLFLIRAGALASFSVAIPVEVILAQHDLRAGQQGYAVLLSAWGAGTILGSGVYSGFHWARSTTLLCLGGAGLALGYLVLAISPTLTAAAAGAALAGTGNGVDAVASRTFLQESVEAGHRTLVLALNESLWQGLPAVGIVAGGLIAASAGARTALLAAAGGSLLIVLLSRLRLRPLERDSQAAVSR